MKLKVEEMTSNEQETMIMTPKQRQLNPNQIQCIRTRAKCLRKMGVSEEDVKRAELLFAQMIPMMPGDSDSSKAERIFGYTSNRLKREKAIKRLGTSEEEVEVENSKNLGALGIGGRRRSFCVGRGRNSLLLTSHHQRENRSKSFTARGRKVFCAISSNAKARRRLSIYKANKALKRRHSTGEVFVIQKDKKEKKYFVGTFGHATAESMNYVI